MAAAALLGYLESNPTADGVARPALRACFTLFDLGSPQLLLRLSKAALMLADSPAVFLTVFKVIFGLSKDPANDALFCSEGVIAALCRTCFDLAGSAPHLECLTLAVGALKNATSEKAAQKAVVAANGLALLAVLLSAEGRADSLAALTSPPPAATYRALTLDDARSRLGQLAVQSTGLLRNVIDASAAQRAVAGSPVLGAILSLFPEYAAHFELAVNVSRLLSKLSLLPEAVVALAGQAEAFGTAAAAVLDAHGDDAVIVVRFCFAMGNVTTDLAEPRGVLAQRCGMASRACALLQRYSARLAQVYAAASESLPSDALEAERAGVEDALTKIVRLLANLATDADVAVDIATDAALGGVVALLSSLSLDRSLELALNVVALITNLTYYAELAGSVLIAQRLQLARALLPMLLADSDETVLEAARAFGNLSQFPDVRRLLVAIRVDEALVILLDHAHPEVLFTVCGVLTNLLGGEAYKTSVQRHGGINRFITLLEEAPIEDAPLRSQLCKALCNFATPGESGVSLLTVAQAELLYALLSRQLEEGEAALGTAGAPAATTEVRRVVAVEVADWCQVGYKLLGVVERRLDAAAAQPSAQQQGQPKPKTQSRKV